MTSEPTSDVNPSDAVLTWAVTLCEPLIPTERRIVLDDQVRRVCQIHPDWACVFYAGVVSDLIQTLPDNDPWRHLSARVSAIGREDMVRGEIPRPPEKTGALRVGGEPFGTYHDAMDLHQPIFTNLDIDVAFAALMTPIGNEAAALLAFCADGWRTGLDAARMIREEAVAAAAEVPDGVEAPDRWIAARAGDLMYQAGIEAIRWAAHRRRAYIGMDDPFVVESCWAWSWRSDRVSAGTGDETMYREIDETVVRMAIRPDDDDTF